MERVFRFQRVAGKMELPALAPGEGRDLISFLFRIRPIVFRLRNNDDAGAAFRVVMAHIADMIGTAQNPRIRLDFIEQLVDGNHRFIQRNTAFPAD